MKDYEKMLKEATEKIPKHVKEDKRLEIPAPQVLTQGTQTIISNFGEIANVLRRDPKHLAKFLFRELAKPGQIDKNSRLILQGKVYKQLIEKKLEEYIKEFVQCKECKKLDTILIKEKRYFFMKCEACGAKETIRKI